VVGKFRAGDIRHCFADTALARARLGFAPASEWREALLELAEWLTGQVAIDNAEHATAELVKRGLVA
jgi:dTDP-L-rhamnose 4-epimerase